MDSIYSEYVDNIALVCKTGNLDYFKSNSIYQVILEHVSQDDGKQYYKCLKPFFSNECILEFCKKNDSIGSPNKYYIDGLDSLVSPTSLRYLLHAYLSLKHMQSQSMSKVDIVEVGCGYGGLCLAIDYVSKILNISIKSYTCIDLDNPLKLQEMYIGLFGTSFPVKFHSASTFGSGISGTNNFLISNYCFSEIGYENRKKYIEILIPKVSHGFMTWNAIPVFNFGKEFIHIEKESPNKPDSSFFVYF